jgi:hypothetical protein
VAAARAKLGARGDATAKSLNYSLNAWAALTRHLVDGDVLVDNNHLENTKSSIQFHRMLASAIMR